MLALLLGSVLIRTRADAQCTMLPSSTVYGSMTFDDTCFEGQGGGSLITATQSLVFNRCSFQNIRITATDRSGIMDLDGGFSTAEFNSCNFTSNSAQGASCVFFRQDFGYFIVSGCRFFNNSNYKGAKAGVESDEQGCIGIAKAVTASAKANIHQSTFESNKGGALTSAGRGSVTLRDSVFTENSHAGQGYAGTIAIGTDAWLEANNCTFFSTKGVNGRAIYVEGRNEMPLSQVNLYGCFFDCNDTTEGSDLFVKVAAACVINAEFWGYGAHISGGNIMMNVTERAVFCNDEESALQGVTVVEGYEKIKFRACELPSDTPTPTPTATPAPTATATPTAVPTATPTVEPTSEEPSATEETSVGPTPEPEPSNHRLSTAAYMAIFLSVVVVMGGAFAAILVCIRRGMCGERQANSQESMPGITPLKEQLV